MKTSTIQYREDYKLVVTLEPSGIYNHVKFISYNFDKSSNLVPNTKLEMFLSAAELQNLKQALDNF